MMHEEDLSCCCADGQAHFLGRAFDRLELDANHRRLLEHSFREVSVQIPVKVAGAVETFDGFRVQHNQARGPSTLRPSPRTRSRS